MGRTVSNASGCAPLEDEFDPLLDDFVSKERKYIHFDLPLSEAERESVSYTSSDLTAHPFWPLIGFVAEERRVVRNGNSIALKIKPREIKFGSHQDAALLEWYAKKLSRHYEKIIIKSSLDKNILAYRSGVGSNINHAKDLFDEVRHRGECTAIALDIKGFFDHIKHQVLRKQIAAVLGEVNLPDCDYKVFRRMTRFEWVDAKRLKLRLGSRHGRGGRICSAHAFRALVRERGAGLIERNEYSFGIPQGTPLSGLYANISMLGFDRDLKNKLDEFGGSYRRYSDDIAILLPSSVDYVEILNFVESLLDSIGLSLSKQKTEVSKFLFSSGVQVADHPFQYLGFTFDGCKTLLRASSLNKYYSKMHQGVRAKIRAAKVKSIPANEIFMRELFRKYTHFGRNMNFPRYAYRAADVLSAPEIRQQVKGHMNVFKRVVRQYIDRTYL